MLCILYVNAAGALLGIVALLIERALPVTTARRWVWCAAIPLSMALPGFYRSHHAWSVTEVSAQPAAGSPVGSVVQGAMRYVFDPGWWTHAESYNSSINRLWLIASGLILIWALINAMRVSHIVSVQRRQGIIDGVPVIVTDRAGPATVGVWRSRVLVPRWVLGLPGIQRQYVLRHEDEHRRSHDALLLFVASLPLILAPWNLALWWQLRRLSLAVEMDCDNRVVSALGDPHAYGELLLRVAEATSGGPRLQPAFLGGAGMLERRLIELVARHPLKRVQRFLLPALALALLLLVVWMPHPIAGQNHAAHVTMVSP